ncbi:hypothetical protein PHLGIDRAFT_266358 [Phlebiopsis gigantea 11061_1 CR5-6]|uniref:Uncharacterized protein n=1 Tax=Phlebiopsis gigantea (strain 11061_1 CR5-6) TaxID=745531 RepID=A0A0C3SBQ5_PHLG1|nr:hypothetical protein PHLGIDRAFT_266358 [Phlebiopsis gigantea 11061_1 CR5-6]
MSTQPPPHDTAPAVSAIVGSMTEGPLWGLNVVVYVICARILLSKSSGQQGISFFLIATLQILVSTGHIVVILLFLLQGFINHGSSPESVNAFFVNSATPVYCAELILCLVNTYMADAIMGWRCYVVWGRNKWMGLFFVVTILSTAACGFYAVALDRNQKSIIDIFRSVKFVIPAFTLSLTTQVFATALIAGRIWYSRSLTTKKDQMFIFWMIVESGAILTACSACILTLFLLHFNAGLIVNEISTQLSCFVPMSILVRVAIKRNQRSQRYRLKDADMINLHNRVRTLTSSQPESLESGQLSGTPFTLSVKTTNETKSSVLGTTDILDVSHV